MVTETNIYASLIASAFLLIFSVRLALSLYESK